MFQRFKNISKGLGDAAKKMGALGKKLGIVAGVSVSMKGVLDILAKTVIAVKSTLVTQYEYYKNISETSDAFIFIFQILLLIFTKEVPRNTNGATLFHKFVIKFYI